MLPEGHTPDNKTLHHIAKLSKLVDGAKASQLLTEEISRRCLVHPEESRNWIITNTDIKNVINAIAPASHTTSIEPSIKPHPQAQQSSRKEAAFAKLVNHVSSKASAVADNTPSRNFNEGQSRPAKREIDALQNPGHSSATSSSFSSSSASASQKRRRVGGEPQPTKRARIVPRASISQVMLKQWEKNTDGSLVEEPSGSMTIVDTTGSVEPEVKYDVNEVEEDFYNATPAPRGGRRRKKGIEA